MTPTLAACVRALMPELATPGTDTPPSPLGGYDALFPTPQGVEELWLLDSLSAILTAAPWLARALGEPNYLDVLTRRRASLLADLPQAHLHFKVRLLTGDYGRAGAVIGRGATHSSRGLNLIRTLYWLALQKFATQGRLDHPDGEALASALRATARSLRSAAREALGPTLEAMATVTDLRGAVAAMNLLEQSRHQALRNAWQGELKKILSQPSTASLAPEEERPGSTTTRTSPFLRKRNPGARRSIDRDEVSPALAAPERIRLIRNTPAPDQQPFEPTEEFSRPVDLVVVPGLGAGEVTGRYATYQARQAVWGGNPLLLTSHFETLSPPIFGAALRCLVEQLYRPGLEESSVMGLCICLLKTISGRTTPGVQAICSSLVAESNSALRLDLVRGELAAPPFWRWKKIDTDTESAAAGFFQPTSEQTPFLEPADGEITLSLPRPIQRVLRNHEKRLTAAVRADPLDLDAMAARAASTVASVLGVVVTVATLRRSLGAQLAEVSGDLALAQLVCGDSFGEPCSQQHYYAPRRRDIERAYKKAVAVHFDESTTTPLRRSGLRVGSSLLVTPAFARELASSSRDGPFPDAQEWPPWLAVHRRRLDHLSRMIIATTGHRPTQALFDLTMHDVDVQAGVALFRDKRHDEAHDPRLAALPTILCKQITEFLLHLEAVAATVSGASHAIAEVHAGLRPLLVDFAPDGAPIRPTIASLKERSPAAWQKLPWNWSRTYLRTRGLEMGGAAFVLACQLGHFDVLRYPYCQQSPTVPLKVIDALRPTLDRLAAAQGWALIGDDAQIPLQPSLNQSGRQLPPLRDWSTPITEAVNAATRQHDDWEQNLRALARQNREAAVERVLEHPTLIAAGVSAAYRGDVVGAAPAETLDEVAVYEIRSDLAEEAGDDAPLAIALFRALRHVLRRAAKKTSRSYPAVPLPIVLRRPLDNPFFAGSCAALQQMHALREHVSKRSRVKQPARTFDLQVARTVEALALFGHIERTDQLLAILEARGKAKPSARIPDLLLTPLRDRTVVALRGIAALALAALAQAHPDEPLPSRVRICSALAEILPQWAIEPGAVGTASVPDLIDRLCSTTSVCNRYELSPAARFALDPERGATHADIDEQLAFIDGDVVAPSRKAEPASPLLVEHQSVLPAATDQRTESAYRQYLRICRTIPSAHKDLELPLTRRRIPANALNLASTRQAVVEELDAHLAQPALWPIVRMLASWIRSEAVRSAGTKGMLADRTLQTYLTRIGRALVQTLGSLEVSQIDEAALEDAFAFCLDASRDARHKVASAILSFHDHCTSRWDLPDIDMGFVYTELDQGRHDADAALILPFERDLAITRLGEAAWQHDPGSFEAARRTRLAHVMAYPLAWGGCRINEALGLQARDVGRTTDGTVWTRVRSNRRRPLKSLAASRRIGYRNSVVEQAQRVHVLQRVEDVRRNAERRPEAAYLIDDDPDRATSAEAIAQSIRQVLAAATGRPTERLHRLRHLIANEWIRDVALSSQDREWIGLDPGTTARAGPLTPRDLAAVTGALGHGHWSTTLQCYLHLPWMLQSRSAQYLRDKYFRRQFVAGALGYTPATLDWILRDRKVDRLTAWFDYFRPRRVRPEPTSATVEDPSAAALPEQTTGGTTTTPVPPTAWTCVRVGELAALANKVRDLESAMRSLGAPMANGPALVEVASRWELKLGLRLLPTHVGGARRTECPARAVRRVHGDRHLERMWLDLDREGLDGDSPRRRLVADFYTWLQPSKRHQIALPRESIQTLVAWLGECGIHPSRIELTDLGGSIIEVSVRRSVDTEDHRHQGMGLRRILSVIGLALDLQRCGRSAS